MIFGSIWKFYYLCLSSMTVGTITYRSQVTVTSLKASEDIVVNSSPNSSLNKKINNQQAAVEIIRLSLHYKYKLRRLVVNCVN